jgi:hypothetical protein
MVRMDVQQQSVVGTWMDGYLPPRQELRQLAQSYRGLKKGRYKLPVECVLEPAPGTWTEADIAGSIAATVRANFDYENLSADERPTPCNLWILQIDREPCDPRMKPIYAEFLADPRRERYYHLITIHEECSVEEQCLQEVLDNLGFRSKLQGSYADLAGFQRGVRELVDYYVGLMTAPFLEVQRLLGIASNKLVTGGP